MGADADRLLAGEIGRPHGLGGEVYVVRISDDPRRFEPGARLHRSDGSVLVVASARTHRDRLLVRFEGVEDRAAAERLRGALFVDAADLRPLQPGEFWERDVVDCVAVDPDGAELGRVVDVVPGAAHDLLELSTARGPRLVPFVRDIVVAVDAAGGRVVVDPPEGLLD